MKESIHHFFRMGILQWMSYPRTEPMLSLRKILCDDFFDVIETSGYGGESSAASAYLKQSRIGVCFGAHPHQLSGGINPNAIDENERAYAEKKLLALLDEAEEIGADGFAFLAGKWEPATMDAAYAQLVKTTTALCQAAEEKDIFVELEVFDYDVDKSVLIGPAPLAAKFAEEIRRSTNNFGLLVDLSHIPICHETAEYTVHVLAPYITHFHYGNAVTRIDAPAYGDKHPRFGFPNGVNDIPELTEYLRVLRKEGFFKPEAPYTLSMEVTPQPGEDADCVVAGTKRVLLQAWKALEESV